MSIKKLCGILCGIYDTPTWFSRQLAVGVKLVYPKNMLICYLYFACERNILNVSVVLRFLLN